MRTSSGKSVAQPWMNFENFGTCVSCNLAATCCTPRSTIQHVATLSNMLQYQQTCRKMLRHVATQRSMFQPRACKAKRAAADLEDKARIHQAVHPLRQLLAHLQLQLHLQNRRRKPADVIRRDSGVRRTAPAWRSVAPHCTGLDWIGLHCIRPCHRAFATVNGRMSQVRSVNSATLLPLRGAPVAVGHGSAQRERAHGLQRLSTGSEWYE